MTNFTQILHVFLTKSAANLIDDSKMNIKMRELRQKMTDKKLQREKRRESRDNSKGVDQKSSNTALPKISGSDRGKKSTADEENSCVSGLQRNEIGSNRNSLPPIFNRGLAAGKLPPPAVVRHGHNDFLSKYNLTSPRQELDH